MFNNNPLANKRVMESTWRCILYHTKLLGKQKPMKKNLNKVKKFIMILIKHTHIFKNSIINRFKKKKKKRTQPKKFGKKKNPPELDENNLLQTNYKLEQSYLLSNSIIIKRN